MSKTTTSKPLIVGLDPGTTTAYAILNLQGTVLKVRSGKNLGLDTVVREISSHGLPLLVGTDKKKTPQMVVQFAARVGAIKAAPDADVDWREKEKLTRNIKTHDSHQKDAVAAGMVAYRQYRHIIERAEKTLREEGRQRDLGAVLKIVFQKKISVRKALERV